MLTIGNLARFAVYGWGRPKSDATHTVGLEATPALTVAT